MPDVSNHLSKMSVFQGARLEGFHCILIFFFFFFENSFRGSFWAVLYCHILCSYCSTILVASLNLKAGCRKDGNHGAFNTKFSVCVIYSCQWLQYFIQSCLVMVATVHSLSPEPALLCRHTLHMQRWVRPRVRAH